MKVLLSWSSGKDSAYALHALRRDGCNVAGLLTTVNEAAGRVAIHGVRRELLEMQAAAAATPLWTVPLPYPCSNEIYESRMAAALARAAEQGFSHVAFGDLFLQDVRQYREEQLGGTGLVPLFPLWNRPTAALAREMLGAGVRAKLSCIDPRVLDRSFAGREFDDALLDALPPAVDPCAERGEFHTFAYDGPMFAQPIVLGTGIVVERDGFVFADLVPIVT